MSANTNLGNTPVSQGFSQLYHTGETGGLTTTLQQVFDGDGTGADLYLATNKVKIATPANLQLGSKTFNEYVQDLVGAMFDGNTETNITATYQDSDGTIDLVSSGDVTLTNSVTLSNKTLTSPVINTSVSGSAILDENDMASNSDTKLATQQSIKAYVDTEVAGIVNSAPSALDTLDELASALGDDANFATTTATNIGTKLAKASNLSDLTNTATARTNLGVDPAGTDNSTNVTLAGSLDYLTLSGQEITRNAIDLSTDITGTLPVGNGGTGATTLASNSILTGNGTSAIQAESGLTYNGSTLAVTGEIDVSDIIHANGNASNRLDLDDDSDSSNANQVTLAGVNNVNIVIDQTNNGTGDFQVRARPTTASDLDTASMILDMDKVTAVFSQDTSQQFKIGGANRFKITEAGVQVQSSSLGVGVTPPSDNGVIQSSGAIICGDGDGDIALTTNDGGGNANITFNHTNQDPDNNGQSGRIHVNVDATSSEANMVFETSSGDVTGGATDVALVDSFKIAHDFIEVPYDIRHMGDTNTQLRFPSNDTIQLRTSGNTRININSSGEIQFNEAYTFPTADGSNAQVLATNGSGNLFFTNALADPYGNLSEFANLNAGISDDGKTITFSQSSAQWIIGPVPITTSGTTADGLLTYHSATTMAVESNLTFDSSNVLTATDGSESMAYTPSNNYLTIHETGATKGSHLRLATDNSDFILTAGGSANQLSLYDVNASANRLIVGSTGNFTIPNALSVTSSITTGYGVAFTNGNTNFLMYNNTGDNLIYLRDTTNGQMLQTWTPSQTTIHKNLIVDGGLLTIDDGGDANEGGEIVINPGTSHSCIWRIDSFYGHLRFFGSTTSGEQMALTSDGNLSILTGTKFSLDGRGGHTYLQEESDGNVVFYADNRQMLRLHEGNGEVVINDPGVDTNFRVEGDTDSNLLFTDAGEDRVGIGTGTPEGKLHIYNGNASVAPDSDGDELVVENSGDSGISILSGEGNGDTGSLIFGSQNDGNGAGVVWDFYNKILNVKTQNSSGILRFASANNSEAMRILANGRVGIGTNSPGTKLHISSGATDEVLRLEGTGSPYLSVYDSGTRQFFLQSAGNTLNFYAENDNTIAFFTSGTRALDIDSSQRVGIGTTSPAEKLHIIGQCFINGQLYGGFGARTTGGTADWNHSTNARSGNGHTLLLSTATNGPTAQTANTLNTAYYHTLNFEYAGYDNDGNMTQIGIPYYFANNDGVRPVIRSRYSGTWSNYHSIPIANSNGSIQGCKGTASNPSYVFNQGSEISETDTGMFCPGANMIGFSNGGTEKIRIDDSGRLLVGNTSVHYSGTHLQVGSTSDSQNGVQIQTSTTGNGYVLFGDGSGASAYSGQIRYNHENNFMSFGTTTGAERLRIDSSGKVGINTSSPDEVLHIFGDAPFLKIENSAENSGGILFVDQQDESQNASVRFDASARSLDFITDSAEAMTILGTGGNRHVGIGTTTPSSKLHVSGGDSRHSGGKLIYEAGGDADYFRIQRASSGGRAQMQFTDESTSELWRVGLTGGGGEDFVFYDGGANVLILDRSNNQAQFNNDVIAFHTSDQRLKDNVKPLDNALDKIDKISGVEFDWIKKEGIHGHEGHDIGVIAQEVEEVLPEVVTTRDNGYKAVKYEKIVPLLIQAIKEQQQQIEELKNG